MGKPSVGKIIVPGDVNVWPHEMETAKSLAFVGYAIEFIRKSNRDRETTADVLIDGMIWEMKAPRSGKKSSIEDNLKKAARQSDKVVFDSRRMKHLPDAMIEQELSSQLHRSKKINQIIFVNRHGRVIDIA
jgi:hypothetical protein